MNYGSMETALANFNRAVHGEKSVTELLQRASLEAHLVSPATACGQLTEGMVVAFSTVLVNVDRETYRSVPGVDEDEEDNNRRDRRAASGDEHRALGKSAIEHIANAAAVTWDSRESGRLDNGRDPRYCHYRAVGSYQHFDGTYLKKADEKEIDLRDGSDYVRLLQMQARRRNKTADARIMHERTHILSFAATKARLRMLRQLGVWSWYTREELAKPFVVVRTMFTGATSDPVLRREFALLQAKVKLLGMSALYGESEPAPITVLAEPHDAPALPPATATTDADGVLRCDYCGTDKDVDRSSTEMGPIHSCQKIKCVELSRADALRDREAAREKKGPASPPASNGARERESESEPIIPGRFKIPGGDERGVTLDRASDSALAWWSAHIDRNLRENKTESRYVSRDKRLLKAMRAELDRRTARDSQSDPYPH